MTQPLKQGSSKNQSKSSSSNLSSLPITEIEMSDLKHSVEHLEHNNYQHHNTYSPRQSVANFVTDHVISPIRQSDDGVYVIMDNKKYLKSDLVQAFGGQMNPGWSVPSIHKFGNPAPLGLSAFAYCTFVASLVDCRARGLTNSQVNTGTAMFYGGFIQFVAGLWEISLENTFGGLAFCSFGGYWMGSASMHIPWFNSYDSYTSEADWNSALGFWYLGWALVTILLLSCTLKSTFLFFFLFVLVFLRLLLLTVYRLYDNEHCEFGAGVVGVLASVLAWYHAYAGMATDQNSYYVVKPIPMPTFKTKKMGAVDEDDTSSDLRV
ncbi:hypothetical protein CANINC_000015 [Pichia inconspicua]|uniref:Ammonia transport outward protein 2 n=1 Tax=Pichia inconspicua TaxID=52247 RepID=A0A4T0X744_9ASCO|nr:hypothetical protein CANINC_000015 [[Candida] inconspicua]